jgi:hypothetical protein
LIADIAKDYKPRGASGVIEYYYDLCQSLNFDKEEEIKILMMSGFCIFEPLRYVLNIVGADAQTARGIAVEPFLGVLAEEKCDSPTLGHAQRFSCRTNKVEIMKILNLRRFENGED